MSIAANYKRSSFLKYDVYFITSVRDGPFISVRRPWAQVSFNSPADYGTQESSGA